MIIPKWVLKTLLQKGIGCLPHSHAVNAWLQKRITKGFFADESTFQKKLECCRKHLDYFSHLGNSEIRSASFLELGTGSWPIVPIGMHICGISTIQTYDIVPFLNKETLACTLRHFRNYIDSGKIKDFLPNIQTERLQLFRSILESDFNDPIKFLSELNIDVRIGDASQTTLKHQSIDFIFSTVVLEHIPQQTVGALLSEFHRISKPTAVMSHLIGLKDQYSDFDKSITPFNFLKYTERQWRFLNNPIIPLSRLRISDYRQLIKDNNFKLIDEESDLGSLEELKSIRLAPEFRNYKDEDLLPLFAWLVSKPN